MVMRSRIKADNGYFCTSPHPENTPVDKAVLYNAAMNSAIAVPRYTLDDYLATEPAREVRHEYVGGEIYAMAGASWRHNLIVSNLQGAIWAHLRGSPCNVVTNDRKVLIKRADSVYYPDLLVRCAESYRAETIDDYTETEPRLIAEVLSPSTEAVDRREKRLAYQKLDSLRDYLIVSQEIPRVEIYHLSARDQRWHYTEYVTDDIAVLASIELELPLSVIYEDTDL